MWKLSTNDHLIRKLLNDPNYEVRSDGTVRSRAPHGKSKEWIIVGYYRWKEGYNYFDYDGRRLKISRIVYQKFVGELVSHMTIDHVNGNSRDDRPENLRQVTSTINLQAASHRKMTMEKAREARAKYSGKRGEIYDLAKEYGISHESMRQILRSETWLEEK